MTITPQPESLCLTGNMASIRVTTDTDITMTLTSGNDELLTHTYSPTADNIVDINLRDIVLSLLSFDLKNQSTPYQQTMICRSFTVTLTDGTDTETVSFKALRAGVDNLSDTVGNFLQHNFLTWQPNVKPVTYYTPEFLTYYAQQQVVVKCLAHIAEGNETTVTLATISADTCVTIPVQYAIIAGLTNALPQWYDVWVETGGGTRLTYKQRYYAQDMRSEQEQWILFENSLGGIDTFRAYGDSDNTAEHTHNVAEIEEVSQEYRVDTERKYKKSTGRLDRNERLWLLDFFPSTRKYIYIGQSLRQIVVVESDVNYKASELPSSYTFTYRYADAKPYLNLPRTDVPLEVLDIQVPDVGSFTVAPRLVEFPATPLSDGALFPVQDPYSEEWGTTTFGAIRQIIAAMVSTAEESFAVLTHTHLNKSFLDGLSWDSIRNHFAQSFLSKTNADTANGVITFVSGLVSNAIAWFKQGIKIGSDANSPIGIDAAGNATLNNVTAGGHVTSPDLRSDEVPNDDNIGGSGYHVYKDANGEGHVCTDYLDVRKKARFTELEIRRLSYINADQVQSMAASKVEKVLPIGADGKVISSDDTTTTVVAYRCLAVADDGSTATKNGWALGDQARCQTFNISTPGNYQNVENRFYWRLVVRVGQCYDNGTIYPSQEEHDGKVYHFFDLANIMDVTADAGDEFDDFFADEYATEDVYEGYMITLVNNERTNLNDIPATEDAVVQMGNKIDTDRMGFFITKADNLHTGPYIYAGVNQFSLVNKMITKITPAEVLISARKLKVFSDPNAGDASPLTHYRGEWTQDSTSYYYDEWDFEGSRWLCLYQGAEGTTEAPGATPANWKEISLKGDSEVTVYKQSATQPATPTGNTIPPTGWHKEPKWFASGEILGEGERGAFNVRTITFTTTKVNQKIRVRLEASSEDGFDFIICGAIDEELDSEALNGEQLANDEDGLIETYHATTGTDVNEFVLTASSIGEYFIQIAYTKDGSNDHNDDLGRYWVGFDDIAIWASVATFSGSTNVSGWSTPVRWNGEDGASPIIADLDNEMDGVACDVGGDSDHSQTCTTTASLIQGLTKKSFTLKIREWNEDDQEYNEITQSGSTLTDVVVNWTNNSDNSKTITFTFGQGVTINDKREFIVVMIADNLEYKAVFTVNGVLPGANGEPATLYQIIPSQDKMAFSRLSSGGLTPDNQYLTFTVKKTVGNETTIIHTAQLEQNNLIARYSTSDPPASKTSGVAWGTGSGSGTTQITFNNIGNAVISKNVTFQQIYIALFGSDGTLHDRETIPVIKDGANGKDGDDGDDGLDAWTLTVNPSPIIIEQNIEDGSFPFSDNSPLYIDMTAKCGDNAATVDTPSNPRSNGMGLTVNAVNSGNHRLSITAYNKDSQTNKYITNGYITCDVPLSYGTRSTTMAVRIQVGVNLLGEWETKIVGDAETSVATKLTNAVINGDINTFQQVGTYIRSASENTAKLTETIGARSNGNNLFGFSKGAIFDGAVPFVQGYGMACVWNNGQAYSRVWNLDFGGKPGYYVVTCEIKAQSEANIRFFLADIPPVDGVGLTNVGNELKVAVTTQWKKITAVYNLTAADIANSNGQLTIRDGSTSNYVFIRYLQIEHGSVPSAFGICADDAANNSEPMHVTWNQSPSGGMFSDETSGNYGPGGTPEYTTNRVYPSRSPQYPEGTGYIELIKGDLVMTEGIYTLSFWARASVNESVMECFCYDATNTETYKGVVAYCDGLDTYYGELDPDQTEGMNLWGTTNIRLTTAWKKYYVHWYMTGASSKISVIPIRINGSHTGGARIDYYIAQIKLERGYVTSANRTEYQTVMRQTARAIDFAVMVNSMEKAGIHLYTSNNTTPESENEIDEGVIDLVAGKVKFKNAAGTVDDKVWIDTTYGTLHAVDGYFSGKIHAVEGDFTDITSQDGHVAIVGTPNSTNNYWRGLAVGDDPVNGDGDLATIGGRFTNASASTGYGYLVIAKNTGRGSVVMVSIDGNDGSVGCAVLKTQRIETNLTVVTGNYVCDSGSFTDSKVVCNYSGTRTIKLPLATTAREIWVRQIGTGTTNVYDALETTLVGSVTKADGWKLFVYIPQTGWY